MNNNKFINILLADDDADDRMMFTDAFSELKMNNVVETVNDGLQLMEHLNKENAKLPDVLFLDLNMPRKNGMECLKEIRKSANLKELIVVIYSTSSSEKDIEDTFVKGANVYITKPASFDKLKEVLSRVVSINWQYQTSALDKQTFLLNL